MAYAAYREFPGLMRSPQATPFHVLDVTVARVNVRRVRQFLTVCADANLLHCEPLLSKHGASGSDAPQARLSIHLPLSSYEQVVHRLIEAVPCAEIGRLFTWREHLERRAMKHG